MKAEFKEERKEVSHVGLYRLKDDGAVVFFCDEYNDRSGIVVDGNGDCHVGHTASNWSPCKDDCIWEKLDANSVTFTW